MRYWPLPTVTAIRTFSIRAELAASTLTPGSTASDESRTTPARIAWADASVGTRIKHPTRVKARASLLMKKSPFDRVIDLNRRAADLAYALPIWASSIRFHRNFGVCNWIIG